MQAPVMSDWNRADTSLPPFDVPVICVLRNGLVKFLQRADEYDQWWWAEVFNVYFDGHAWKSDPEINDDYDVVYWRRFPNPSRAIANAKGVNP